MPNLSHPRPDVSPLAVAGLLLAAWKLGEPLGLELPRPAAILAATGAGRSRAYERRDELLERLSTLERRPGRPAAPSASASESAVLSALTQAAYRFVLDHPGCVHAHGERSRYGDVFRRFVVGLRAEHESVSLEDFAQAVLVPLGTLKSWLSPHTDHEPQRAPASDAETEQGGPVAPSASDGSGGGDGGVVGANVEAVLTAYAGWAGGFRDFCDHVREQLGIRWGRDTIARLLEVQGARKPRRRAGRSPDERALRGAFETFFGGAQWVGDGKLVPVTVDGQTFQLNFELQCDAFSGAFVGTAIRPTEDSTGVVESFRDGVETTGAAPVALLLDNKPCNHTDQVDEALGESLRIRATPSRPQNKAHVEGGFGLFSQTAPELSLDTRAGPGQLAAQVLARVTTTWCRAINHRPRNDRSGASRVELYAQEPTDEQIAAARRALEERQRRQEQARQTLEARQRPEVRAFLDQAFERLALDDPERHLRIAIARHPFDAIVDAVALFEAKQSQNSLPDSVDARYLLGIVNNVAEQREGQLVAERLLRLRRQARDLIIERAEAERRSIVDSCLDPGDTLALLVDRALLSDRALDRTFWLDALADFVLRAVDDERDARYLAACRTIASTFRAEPHRRQQAALTLAQRLQPLD